MRGGQVADGSYITVNNYENYMKRQRTAAARAAAEARRRGVEILTALTAEQLLEDKRDELLTWPARWDR